MALLMAIAGAPPAFAADGDLDLTFGIGGKLRTTIPGANGAQAVAVAVQADGKIIVAMNVSHMVTPVQFRTVIGVVRYNPDGSLDTTFNGTGVSIADGLNERAADVAIQPDGKIVVGGTTDLDPSDFGFDGAFLLLRFNADGTQDFTFGASGRATTNLVAIGSIENLNAIAVDTDGAIVSVGGAELSGTGQDFVVTRHHANGAPDTSFDGDGIVTTSLTLDPTEELRGVAIQADGRIVATGSVGFSLAPFFAVVRYLGDGSLDQEFGSGGVVLTAVDTFFARLGDVVVQPDQRIVVGGHIQAGAAQTFLARYVPDGTLDTTFGIGGIAKGLTGLLAHDIALQADGKILATGIHDAGFPPDFAFKVGRFTAQGLVDFSFGIQGIVTTDFSPNVTSEGSSGVAVQADGKIVLAGSVSSDVALARYHGTPPPTPPIAFFLHGDASGLSHPGGGPRFTMSLTPPAPQTLTVRLVDAPSWTSDRTLTGAFLPGASFQLRIPCAQTIPGQKIARVFAIDRQGNEQQVAVATHPAPCTSSMLFKLPLGTAAPLFADKLSLRVSLQGAFNGVDVDIPLGQTTFFNVTGFAGTLQTLQTP